MTCTRMAVVALGTGLALSGPATAQDFYGQIFGGYSFGDDFSFSGLVGGAPNSVGVDQDDGFLIGGAIGLRFSSVPGLRGDLELSYSENDIDGLAFSGNGPAPEVNVNGDVSSTSLLANLYYDFETGGPVTPYVGGGLGVSFVDVDAVYGPGVRLDSSDEVFTLQLVAGASYDLSERTALFSEVRFRQLYDVSTTRVTPAGGVSQLSDDIQNTSINFGVRFNF